MQENIALKISAVGLAGIKVQAAEIESILLNELLSNKAEIEDLIISYYFKSRGRIFDLRILKPVIDKHNKGYFYVYYNVGHFNACADIDTHEAEKMKIDIDVNLEKGALFLTGEYFPEREPDEF